MMTSQPIVWTTICTGVFACVCVCACVHFAYLVCHPCTWLSAHIKSDKLRSMTEILKRHASDILQKCAKYYFGQIAVHLFILSSKTKNLEHFLFYFTVSSYFYNCQAYPTTKTHVIMLNALKNTLNGLRALVPCAR